MSIIYYLYTYTYKKKKTVESSTTIVNPWVLNTYICKKKLHCSSHAIVILFLATYKSFLMFLRII